MCEACMCASVENVTFMSQIIFSYAGNRLVQKCLPYADS